MIEVMPGLSIPESEVRFTTSRSSGPGGQNVNKVETRVTLLFDVVNSPSLSEAQRQGLRDNLKTRITRAGVLRVVAQVHRGDGAHRAERGDRSGEPVRGDTHAHPSLDDGQHAPAPDHQRPAGIGDVHDTPFAQGNV